MKGSLFSKPLEWSIETAGESWQQGSTITGTLKVKNHGSEGLSLKNSGVALAHGEMKKIHSREEGALQLEVSEEFKQEEVSPGEEVELAFSLKLPENSAVSDKKSSYYLTYGKEFNESHLQLKIEPYILFTKVIGLLDTFHRFKLKELKSSKKGLEYKLLPPTARDMANIESLILTPSMQGDVLAINFAFQVKKLDTASVTTKVTKETLKVKRELTAKEYSLGRDMINQDQLLKSIESVLSEVKLKSVF
jgi:hypothetical protein